MKTFNLILFVIFLFAGGVINAQNMPVIIEAEAATPGSDFEVKTENNVTFIAPKTDFNNASYPGIADKVVAFSVTFNTPGQYKLYARIRIGSGEFNDDSFFYGNGFGTKDPANGDDWVTCNGLVTPGFSFDDQIVDGEGSSGAGIWKWVSLSDFTGGEAPIFFDVLEGDLVQTFEIGAREDGLQIDKIAFGEKGIYFTVINLNNGEAGSDVPPEKPDLGPVLAENHDKFLGCSYGSGENTNEFLSLFNQVTPENAGKWGSVESTRDAMNWGSLDAIYDLAKENGLKYKHHVLVWGSQQPSWISSLSTEEQLEEIEEWFAAVAGRYPDIDQIEVVNEPLDGHAPPDGTNNHANYIEALGGRGETGWDWIITSFQLARKYFPNTQLLINEYGIINSTTNTQKYIEIIKLLNDRGLIDGICFQAHGFSMKGSVQVMKNNLDAMAAFGLPIYPAELDIDGETDKKHLEGYMNYFKMIWEHPAVKGVTLWGYNPDMWRGEQGAYLIDKNGVERPAMKWLRAYLNNSFVPNESIQITTATGDSIITEIGGSLQLEAAVYPDTSTITKVTWAVDKTSLADIDENGKLTAKKEGTVKVTASSIEFGSTVKATKEITIDLKVSANVHKINEEIKLYPNPVVDFFTMILPSSPVSIYIFNSTGNLIFDCEENNGSKTIDMSNYKQGIYFLKIKNLNKTTLQKIIKI